MEMCVERPSNVKARTVMPISPSIQIAWSTNSLSTADEMPLMRKYARGHFQLPGRPTTMKTKASVASSPASHKFRLIAWPKGGNDYTNCIVMQANTPAVVEEQFLSRGQIVCTESNGVTGV